jgi:hypothetical protein
MSERLRASAKAIESEQFREDSYGFLTRCCYTTDEADSANPIKLIPDLPQIRFMHDQLLVEKATPVFVGKCRRMVISWTATSLELYQAIYRDHSGIFVQSKMSDDSCELVHRHWFMLQHLPEEWFPVISKSDIEIRFSSGLTVKRYRGAQDKTSAIVFSNGSSITAVAEGANKLRQYGTTWIRAEEISFWDAQEESYQAAQVCCQPPPGVEQGGQYLAITTPMPSWTGSFIFGQSGVGGAKRMLNVQEPAEGIKTWENPEGARVFQIDYWADPNKRSSRYTKEQPHDPEGEWFKRATKGMTEKAINREFLNNWSTYAGRPVINGYRREVHLSKGRIRWDPSVPMIGEWDFGGTPCVTISQLTARGQWLWVGEICTDTRPLGSREAPPSSDVGEMGDTFLTFAALRFPGARWVHTGDPAGEAKGQGDGRSCYDILADKGIHLIASSNNLSVRIEAEASWFRRMVDGQPAVLIDEEACPMLVAGLDGGYRYAEVGKTGKYKDEPEKNQFSHPHDCKQYGAILLQGLKVTPARKKHTPEPTRQQQKTQAGGIW